MLCQRKNVKIIYFVASSLMKYELKKVPTASEANNEKTQIELTIKI